MKTNRSLIMLSALGLGLAAVGCDSTSGCTDAGVCPDGGAKGGSSGLGGSNGAGGAGGAGPSYFKLSEGTYCFDIKAATVGTDGCDLGIPGYVGTQVPVTYTIAGAVGTVAVGKMGSLGAGPVNQNKGALTRENSPVETGMPACMWHQTDMSTFELIGDWKFTVGVTETQSLFATACTDGPPTDPCTSTFTFTMQIHTPATMPDPITGDCL